MGFDNDTVVALGIFDGVHTGHRRVISTAVELAVNMSLRSAVCTFDAASVDTKGSGYRPIYSDEMKRQLILSLGTDKVFSLPFSDVKQLSAEEFMSEYVFGRLKAGHVVCGRDFRLGRGAECGVDGLGLICKRYGASLNVVDDVTFADERISSASIRKLISEGDISYANALLGEDYTVHGTVVQGNRLGRQLDFPTANQVLDSGSILPRFGVYSSYSVIGGVKYTGISNIGIKPTVGSDVPLCETHFPGFDGDLYGKVIDVRLTGFIRSEKRFDSLNELKMQIKQDIASCYERS